MLEFIKENMQNRIMPEYQALKLDNIWPIENIWAIIRMKLMKKGLSRFKSSQKRNRENFDIS